MGKGTDLTSEAQGKIARLCLAGWSKAKIASTLHRSRTAFSNYLKKGPAYDEKRRNSGRKAKITPRVRRSILRLAGEGRHSSRKMKVTLEILVNTSRIQNVLSKSLNFRYEKLFSSPPLTEDHCKLR